MRLEQFPESENAPNAQSEALENFENSIEARSKTASFFLSALVNNDSVAGNLNRIVEPENKTDVINIQEEVRKSFEQGEARFCVSAPFLAEEDGKKINTNISVIYVENNNSEATAPVNCGARFIMRQKINDRETDIAVLPFSNSQNTAENPYVMKNVSDGLSGAEKDRYLMFVANLNLYVDILRAMKLLGKDETSESYAIRTKINEFIGALDEEYPKKYHKELVKEILQN